tara:strand:- start:5666 stop:6598 length:933 start_codon:yes stop_codon:yes gene_type:complete
MQINQKILITGGSGLVGNALYKNLQNKGYKDITSISSKECNLINKDEVKKLFDLIKPDYVFHLAAKVYGIGGNKKFPSDVLYENVMINTNVVDACKKYKIKKIVAMGSGCVYPDLGSEELSEDQIWLGPPHNSEAYYAHSKRFMLAHLDSIYKQYGMDYVFAISGNIFGPHDSFNINHGHVTPSLIHKFFLAHKNKEPINIWGTGKAIRDFSFSADIAEALFLSMKKLSGPVNIASGNRHSINDIVDILSNIYDNKIKINYDSSKPDGQMVRFYNIEKLISAGFKSEYSLKNGIIKTHNWFLKNVNYVRK